MGLAASQARLLFITSRQNDVSAKMQRISNETMILARDEDEVLQEYNRLLEGGSTTTTSYKLKDDAILNYNDMMGKGAVSTGAPYIITTSSTNGKGKVVLSTSVASSLGLDPSKTTLAANNIDSAAALAKAAKADADVIKILDKTPEKTPEDNAKKISIMDFLTAASPNNTGRIVGTSYGYHNGLVQSGYANVDFNGFCQVVYNDNKKSSLNEKGCLSGIFCSSQNAVNNNGSYVDIYSDTKSLSELYKKAGNLSTVMLLGTSQSGANPNFNAVESNFRAFTNNAAQMVLNGFSNNPIFNFDKVKTLVQTSSATLVNYYKNHVNGEQTTSNVNMSNSDIWFKNLSDKNGYGWDDGASKYNENSTAMSMIAAKGFKGIVAARNYDDGNQWIFSIDAGTYIKELVNLIFSQLTNGSCQETSSDGTTSTTNSTDSFEISSAYVKVEDKEEEEEELPSASDEAAANYYNQMYNALKNGYLIDDSIDNSTTLKEKLTNNTYYVNTKPATSNSDIFEVETETKTSKDKADSYWNTEMTKIKRKEDKMNKDLQKLQTEYTSLTTDYQSVKSIITANIGKSYTYCQNG